MKKNLWIISGVIGIVLGYLIGNFAPFRQFGTLALDSGNYCCDRIDISQKCIKQTGPCPADKPIVVSIP